MSIVERYLNLNPNNDILRNLGIEISSNIIEYNKFYKETNANSKSINDFIGMQIETYIQKKYTLINVIDADINYYIEHINLFVKNKFRDIICEIGVDHLISMCDYLNLDVEEQDLLTTNIKSQDSKKNYLIWRAKYYRMLYENLLGNEYKPIGHDEKASLLELIDSEWKSIRFDNLIGFTKTLNKILFFGQPVNKYVDMIANKFDNQENILKLLDYINEQFKTKNKSDLKQGDKTNTNLDEEFITDESDDGNIFAMSGEDSKYSFRFIVDNLKSNGYLLFEQFNIQLKTKYKKSQKPETIYSDKRLINYFIYTVSQKDSNSVNRKVNEILIRMRDYLYDIEDNYKNNIGYNKITVKQESEKYKSMDLSSYDRTNANFNMFKYSNTYSNPVPNFKINSNIEPYFDIYRAYYSSRYPDRQIEFDPFQSTLFVRMVFLEKIYFIHMALIQYIVLEHIFKSNEGIGLIDISTKTDIPISHLQETINSLLQIKIIKRSNANSIENLKFFINYDFAHENNKISISSLVIKEKEDKEIKKEFMHDRNTIILSNLYDYVKKNRTFTKDVLITELQHKIPFKINHEQIELGVKTLLDKEDIVMVTIPSPYSNDGVPDIIYKYVE
jgi:hypothetical protein